MSIPKYIVLDISMIRYFDLGVTLNDVEIYVDTIGR